MHIASRRHRVAQSPPDSGDDELSAELTAEYWEAHNQRIAAVSFRAMARRLPGLIGQAVRLGWEANRRDTTATVVLNLASGIFTGYALLATTGVLQALFASGPTRTGSAPRCRRWSWWRSPPRPGPGCSRPRAGRSPGSSRRWTAWSNCACST